MTAPNAEELISPRTDAFQYLDRDGDGFITAQDLVTGLGLMGHSLTYEEALEMMSEAKADSEGRVTVEDMKSLLASYGVA